MRVDSHQTKWRDVPFKTASSGQITEYQGETRATYINLATNAKRNVNGIFMTKSSSAKGSFDWGLNRLIEGSAPALNCHCLKAFTAAPSRALCPVDCVTCMVRTVPVLTLKCSLTTPEPACARANASGGYAGAGRATIQLSICSRWDVVLPPRNVCRRRSR